MVDDYEVFIADINRNIILSLNKDDIYFFNKANFEENDFIELEKNNIQYLIDKGLALKLDTNIIYKMYLGFINKPVCKNCSSIIGTIEGAKGFGNLPA